MVTPNVKIVMFSVIIPTYNRAHHLTTAFKSVQSQTLTDWELIVVDDGSTDDTKEVVASFNDPRIIYVYQENAERSAARNNGIQHANGEWICFLDSDDYFLPNHLESFHQFIIDKDPTPCFIITGGYEEHQGALIKKTIFDPANSEHPAHFILRETIVTPISVCIHRSCLETHEFPEIYKKSYWEDTHLWIRLAIAYPFYQLPIFTNVLAEHPGRSVNSNISMTRVNDHIGMIRHLYENYKDLLNSVISKKEISHYIDRKYRMFLYQARQNKQLAIAINIWWRAMTIRPSWNLLTEFPKIFLNQLNIGIHDR